MPYITDPEGTTHAQKYFLCSWYITFNVILQILIHSQLGKGRTTKLYESIINIVMNLERFTTIASAIGIE